MSKFSTKTTPLNNFDPFKRVDYPFGMLLSPAEFFQEQLYFVERNRLHHRLLHGYGTVCGLKVTVKGDDEIRVSAGLAIDVLGKLIRVENEKCASLKLWLKEHSDEFSDTSPPVSPPYNLYIVLCYRECPSDKVLIRTSPCQPKEQSENYSRIQESAEIKIVTEEPLQKEEDIIRKFGDIFAGIPVSKDAPSVDIEIYKKKIADLVRSLDSEESPTVVTSPPSGLINEINPQDAEILFRHAFKIWVTEVKPKLVLGKGCLNSKAKDNDNCVLLAQLIVNEIGKVTKVTINEENRPYLLSTRLIQEYFLNRSQGEAGPYQIVAAGRFNKDGSSRGAVYGELKVTDADPNTGNYILHFPKYKNPDNPASKHTYIVKGIGEGEGEKTPTFHVIKFMANNKGISVRITGGGGVMVEISRIVE